MNILLVDDNKHFIEALRFMIQEHFAYRVTEIFIAYNGLECMEILHKQSIDIIFMDKEMPIMNGTETTKKVVDMYRDIKIIAVSFHSELQDITQMLEAGARNYIIKEEITPEIIEKCLVKF